MSNVDRKRSRTRTRPPAAVTRLSLYLRQAELLQRKGLQFASSEQLAEPLGISDAQVRRDLATFGQFGLRGQGYKLDELIAGIRRVLGTDQRWPVALVGYGNLGRALVGYQGFRERGFEISAVFDSDPAKIGQVTSSGIVVEPAERISERTRQLGIRLGILAVPSSAAQQVTDQLVAGGVEGILNFAPTQLSLPPGVYCVSVDLTVELESLAFLLQWAKK